MKFLSPGVARQHRKARDDLIVLLLYGFSNLRHLKHNISDVLKTTISKFGNHFFPLYPEEK